MKTSADLILHNGRITTLDSKHPEASNLAIKDGRIVGVDALHFAGWQRLNAEYAKQFGVEAPGNWPPRNPGA